MRAVNLGVDVVTLLPHLMTTPPYDGATAPAAASCWGGKQEGFCNGLSGGFVRGRARAPLPRRPPPPRDPRPRPRRRRRLPRSPRKLPPRKLSRLRPPSRE